MKYKKLHDLFIDLLFDVYSAEEQILASLPLMIKQAKSSDLKEGFKTHLAETKMQVKRLDEIFKILDTHPDGEFCPGISGILKEGEEVMETESPSPICDAALIAAGQKVEHYEIAAYTTLYNFANHFDYSNIAKLLKETLAEETHTLKKLSSLAEGGIFTKGINKEAEKMSVK